MRYFYMGAHLRWLISTTTWPKSDEYQKMVKAYTDAVFQAKTASGIRAADFVPFGSQEEAEDSLHTSYNEKKEVAMSVAVYAALRKLISHVSPTLAAAAASGDLHPRVNRLSKLSRDRMTFATSKAGLRNSFVLFDDPLDSEIASPRAGQIADIFLHGRREGGRQVVEPFVLINEYRALKSEDAEQDPFRQFPDLETRLFYNHFERRQRLVRFCDIRCHFAAFTYKPSEIDAECIVARSLNRVRCALTA